MRHLRSLMPVLALIGWLNSAPAQAGFFVGISVSTPPPLLPVYVQPPCPAVGYLWTPGYWAYDDAFNDYYWVPGTWVHAPQVGFLWTPGYWGWNEGLYIWHAGYWGPHVGFYGGIDYGFGYTGGGYYGGYWDHGAFVYNTSVTNVNTTIIHNTYNKTVVVNKSAAKAVSYNGGPGGTMVQPTAEQKAAAGEHHIPLTQQQTQHERTAGASKELRASINKGNPAVPATNHVALSPAHLMAAHTVLHGAVNHARTMNHTASTLSSQAFAASNSPAISSHNHHQVGHSASLYGAGRARPVPRRYSVNAGVKSFHPHLPQAAYHAPAAAHRRAPGDNAPR